MRLLLISDTHGNLEILNRLAEEAEGRLQNWFDTFDAEWNKTKDKIKTEFQPFVDQIRSLPPRDEKPGRRENAAWWYTGIQNLNLPDAEVGYAVFETETMRFISKRG